MTDPATQHLEEMRDLAERILAMTDAGTLAHYETGKPRVAVWDLAGELAELVRHYEPRDLEFVYVYNCPESFSDDELYVFETEADADAFAAARGYGKDEGAVSEEPVFFAGSEHTSTIVAAASE